VWGKSGASDKYFLPFEGDQLEYGGGKLGLLFDCDYDKSTCKLLLNVFMKSYKPAFFQIRAQILKKDYSNQFQPFLVDVSFGLCDVIAKKSYLPYAVMVWKLLKRYSNINHTCPYSVCLP